MSRYSLVYITTKNQQEALKIAKAALANRLAAGSNIINNIQSLYWWKGKVQSGREAILILKTKHSMVAKLIIQVKALHSYECPCIVEIPLGQGNPDFFRWLMNSTF